MENKKISKSRNKRFIYRLGAKDNDIKHFKHLLPMDISKVVEPFGGSYAVCRCVYYEDKYDKYVNDNSVDIIEVFNNLEETHKLYLEWGKHVLKNKGEYTKKIVEDWNKLDGNEIIKKYIVANAISNGYHVKTIPNVDDGREFIKKVKFTSYDYKDCMMTHMDNKDCFIFLDPPYMFSNNKSYSTQFEVSDCTDYLIDILEMFKSCKCKIMLVINDLKITRHLFRDYNFIDYVKTYGLSKRKERHLVITNY